MPAFEYEALDALGKTKRGILSADSERQARRELRQHKLTPVQISVPRSERAAAGGLFQQNTRISPAQLVLMTRQLAALIGASTPLEEALNAIAHQSEKPGARTRILAVRERVMEGWRFADALGEDPKSFPPLYRATIAAGETSGDLGGVLDRLANMLEKSRSMNSRIVGAIIYPAALAVVAGIVVTALMVFVVPKIVDAFNDFDTQLPLLTRVVIGVSNWVVNYGLYALIGAVILSVGLWRALKEEKIKLVFDRQILRLPIIGKLSRAVNGARFARTLATLFSGGAPLLDSIVGAQRTVTNAYIRQRLDIVVTMVGEGASLAASLKRAGELPPMLTHMVAAGERAGALPELLDKGANQLEEEFDTASTIALRLFEPAIIISMGGAVLVIVLAILLPILRLNALAGG